jgi:hypothetical protein
MDATLFSGRVREAGLAYVLVGQGWGSAESLPGGRGRVTPPSGGDSGSGVG